MTAEAETVLLTEDRRGNGTEILQEISEFCTKASNSSKQFEGQLSQIDWDSLTTLDNLTDAIKNQSCTEALRAIDEQIRKHYSDLDASITQSVASITKAILTYPSSQLRSFRVIVEKGSVPPIRDSLNKVMELGRRMVDSRIQLFAFFRKNRGRVSIENEQLVFLDDESRSTFQQLCAQIEESDDALSDLALSEMASVAELRARYGVIDSPAQ